MAGHGRQLAVFALVAFVVACARDTARAAAPGGDDEAFITVYGGTAGLHPGEVGTVPVYLSTTFAVGGLEHTLAFEPQARILADDSGRPRCTTLALGREALITFEPPGCARSDCTGVRVRLPALGGLDPFPASTPLYRCTVAAASDAALGAYPLHIAAVIARDPSGAALPLANALDGRVDVLDEFPATIAMDTAVALPGARTVLTARLAVPTGARIAGTQNDVVLGPQVRIPAKPNGRPMCRLNPDILLGGSSFAFIPAGCDPIGECIGIRALVLSVYNVDPIADGTVLYDCDVAVAPDAAPGQYRLELVNPAAADLDGNPVPVNIADGVVVVQGPAPTATPQPSATATPTTTAARTVPATPTHRPGSGGCAVAAGARTDAWALLIPALALGLGRLVGRRRRPERPTVPRRSRRR
jgi:hypothetical protein